MFRRKTEDDVTDSATEEDGSVATVTPVKIKAYTPSKKELGVVTPKRKGGRVVEAPPANRREALKRARAKQRQARVEQRAGMMEGKEEYLLPRDKGPERALVRDLVDSRRNLASYFLPSAVIIVIGGSGSMPPAVRTGSTVLWFVLLLATVVDSVLLCRRLTKMLAERFPRSTVRPRSLYFYAVMRSISLRRMRIPKPRVKTGAKI
jgi:hypothetical protein